MEMTYSEIKFQILPNSIIVLSEYGGAPRTFGVEVSDRSVQIIVRRSTYSAAKAASWAVFEALVIPDDPIQNLTATRWGIVSARSTPIKLLEDAHTRISFVFNLGITTLGD